MYPYVYIDPYIYIDIGQGHKSRDTHTRTHTHTHTHTNACIFFSFFLGLSCFFPLAIYYGSSKALLRLYQGKAGAKTLRLNTALVVPQYSLNRA